MTGTTNEGKAVRTSPLPPPPRQDTAEHASFVTSEGLAGHSEMLQVFVVITENIEVEDKVLASSGFSDVRSGTYGTSRRGEDVEGCSA